MSKELFIKTGPDEVVIALLEDKVLVELHKEKKNTLHSVGDVFLGRVKKVMPGLNAAFVDVGSEKEAFLHYLDLGVQINTINKYLNCALHGDSANLDIAKYKLQEDLPKNGKISNFIKQNQSLLVQVVKEPISTKGPRVNGEISFAGRFLVLVPFSNKVSISQKIKNPEERGRLKNIIQSIRPKNFGVIIRTVAEGKTSSELDNDLRNLVRKWDCMRQSLHGAKPPFRAYSEVDKTVSILRDFLSNDFQQVLVDDPQIYEEVRTYIEEFAPEKKDIVKLHKGKESLFDVQGIAKQIKGSFGKIVPIRRNGAYLVIEHTEALHVIDVNSGHRVNADQSQESNALDVNLDAAAEVARQMRLRDMGGIIVVDFIDQRDASNRKKLYDTMVAQMAKDPAKHNVLPPSKFGLVQITRQRVRPQTQIQVLESCPTCAGSGEVKSSAVIADQIERDISYLIEDQNEKGFTLALNPYIYAFFRLKWAAYQRKWFFRYKRWIKLRSVSSFHYLEYKFFDKNGEEIQL